MTAVAAAISQLAQALSQGKLRGWPVVCQPPADALKLTWSMKQLISVIENAPEVLQPEVTGQENKLILISTGDVQGLLQSARFTPSPPQVHRRSSSAERLTAQTG